MTNAPKSLEPVRVSVRSSIWIKAALPVAGASPSARSAAVARHLNLFMAVLPSAIPTPTRHEHTL